MTTNELTRGPVLPAPASGYRSRPAKKRRPGTSRISSLRALVWVLPAVLMLAVFVYLPLAQNFGFSVLEWDIYTGSQSFIGAENYRKMFADPVTSMPPLVAVRNVMPPPMESHETGWTATFAAK